MISDRMRGLCAAVCLLLAAGPLAADWPADMPRKVQDLDPKTRQQFDALRLELTAAQQHLERAWERAYQADPLLRRAVKGEQPARDAEQQARQQMNLIEQSYESRGPAALEQFKRWQACHTAVFAYSWIEERLRDPDERALHQATMQTLIQSWAKEPSHAPDGWASVLPAPTEDVTPDLAVKTWMAGFKSLHDGRIEEYGELLRAVEPPRIALDCLEQLGIAGMKFMSCDIYSRTKTPASISEAKQQVKAASNALYAVWPYRAQAEQDLRNAKQEAEKLRRNKAKNQGPAVL